MNHIPRERIWRKKTIFHNTRRLKFWKHNISWCLRFCWDFGPFLSQLFKRFSMAMIDLCKGHIELYMVCQSGDSNIWRLRDDVWWASWNIQHALQWTSITVTWVSIFGRCWSFVSDLNLCDMKGGEGGASGKIFFLWQVCRKRAEEVGLLS